jgi:hypothetical protein
MNHSAAGSGGSLGTEIVDAASGGKSDLSPASGDPSRLRQKPRSSHIHSLHSIVTGFLAQIRLIASGSPVSSLCLSAFCILAFALKGFAGNQDSLATRYEKGLNNDEWLATFRYDQSLGSGTFLRVQDMAASSRLRVAPSQDKWKDQQNLAITLERRVLPGWNLLLAGDSRLFSDKQSGYANDIQTHSISLGTNVSNKWFRIPLSVGPKQDSRFGRTDDGLSCSAGIQIPRLEAAGYLLDGSMSWDREDLTRRKNGDTDIELGVHRIFEEGAADTLRYTVSRQRRDYYISPAGDVEDRSENGQALTNALNYRISRPLAARISGSIYTRTLTINDFTAGRAEKQRERRDFRAQGSVDLGYVSGRFNAGLAFAVSGEEQNYWLIKNRPGSSYSGMSSTPDNKSMLTSLAFRLGGRFGNSDSLMLYSCLQKHQYDTPDPLNNDDRDELRFWIDLQERHSFSDELELKTSLAIHYFHQVYVFGEKSGDNNQIRIISLHPEVRWMPSAVLRVSQAAEVLANYVEYDYESLFPGIRSFLYRKFRLEDSIWVSPTPRISLFAQARLELDENGKLLWNPWLEQRLIDRRSVGWTVSLDYHPFAGLHLMPGFTVYRRRGYRYPETVPVGNKNTGRELNLEFSNNGPVFKIAFESVRLFFTVTIGATRTRTLNAPSQDLTRMDLNMSWKL